MDKITEEIAHFIGSWHLSAEEGRARHDYHVFRSPAEPVRHDEAPEAHTVTIKATFDFDDFDPNASYVPSAPDLYWSHTLRPAALGVAIELSPWSPLHLRPEGLPAFHLQAVPKMDFHRAPSLTVEPPGSVAIVAVQHAVMSDKDFISLGGHGLTLAPQFAAGEPLAPLLEKALLLDPFADLDVPGSSAEMTAFVAAARESLNAHGVTTLPGATVFSAKGASLDGLYVNGVHGQEMPDYLAYRPKLVDASDMAEDQGEPSFVYGGQSGDAPSRDGSHVAHGSSISGEGLVARPSTIDVATGDNLLINSAVLTNNWLAASVTAVLGNHVEMNAIVQTNVWSDLDNVTSALGASLSGPSTSTFNIAAFSRIDASADDRSHSGPAGDHGYPASWAITQVTGDLLITNWIQQINFMLDGDVAVLSAAGAKVEIVAGANQQVNAVSLAELGKFYDLIIVGGSVYDVNIIAQMNILLDDDTVGASHGFASTGANSLATGGNLLWNQAGIVNVGAADRFDALTDGKREAVERLVGGDKHAPGDLLKDDAFAGMGTVRALFISGDIINLQFIKQTNVLGDADKVALAMNAVKPVADSTWSVSTGHNTLVNHASIVDVDALGATHVGGGIYSDEILIQADLMPSLPNAAQHMPGADALVNEAVAFLSDDAMATTGMADAHAAGIPLGLHVAQADPMHVLAA